jgi:PleD family two-component response regulator
VLLELRAGDFGAADSMVYGPKFCRVGNCFRESEVTSAGQMGRFVDVLIVEDDPVQRSDLVELVVALDLRAAAVGNGREALATLETSPASVILTDLMMPGMDGSG